VRTSKRNIGGSLQNWQDSQLHTHFTSKYCDPRVCVYVCMSVCLSARRSLKHIQKLREIFRTCYFWPWLDPPRTTTQYVMYFRFCGWRHVFT